MYRKLVLLVFCTLATLSSLLASGVAAHTLSGTVYGGGNPLPGAVITLADAGTLASLGTTTTTAGGVYSFSVNDGSYNLTIVPPGGSGFSESVVKNVVVSGGDVTQNVVLIARACILSGAVLLRDGTPVSGVSVLLTEQASGAEVDTFVTGADGRYSFPVSPGTYAIRLSGHTGSDPRPPGMPYYFLIEPAVAGLVVGGDTTRDITLPFVALSGKMLDHDGKTVAGVGIEQQASWMDTSVTPNVLFQIAHTLGDVVSEGSGSYRMFLFPHRYDLTVRPPAGSGFATTVFRDVSLAAETSRDFILDRESILSGVLRRLDGTPVGGVSVRLTEQASGADMETFVTGADGRYSFSVSPGTYTIHLSGHTGSDPRPPGMPYYFLIEPAVAGLVVGGDMTRDITLPFVALSGKMLDHDGKTVAGVGIEQQASWMDTAVTPNVLYQIAHTLGDVVSEGSGNYRMFLFPHRYDLTVLPPAGSGLATTVFKDVSLAAPTSRDFILDRESILCGVLRRLDGTLVSGVSVLLTEQASGAEVDTFVTGADGRYSFPVSPGTYAIRLSGHTGSDPRPPGMPYYFLIEPAVAGLVVGGDTTRDITVPLVTMSGWTTDRNGVAVPGVEFQQQSSWMNPSTTPAVLYQISHTFGDATSDDTGKYRMQLFPHRYDLTVQPPAGSGFGQTLIGGLSVMHAMLQNIILDFQDVTAPAIISGPTVSAIADTTAVVAWQTSEPANGGVTYGTSSPPSTAVAEAAGYRTLHTRVIGGLSPDTTYFVFVTAADESGNGPTASGTVSFHTRLTPDVAPPVIVAGPIVSGITHEEAVVEWSTDEPATGEITYGLAGDPGEAVADETLATSHRVVLSGLTADSLYHVQVAATDAFGNGPALSPVIGFHTVAAPDTTPPVIVEGPLAIDITATTATIIWSTDEPATSGVSWNDGTAYDLVSDPALTTTHLVTLTNLRPGTQYFYVVSTTDGAGNGPTLSNEATFTTASSADTDPPVITRGPWVHVVNNQKAQITWETDEPCDSVVEFGFTAAALVESESKVGLVIHHTVDLNHLEEDTTYFFRVRSTDESGNSVVSAVLSFRTTEHDEEYPVCTLGPEMVYASDAVATVRWETNVPTDTVVEYSAPGQPVQRLSNAEKTLSHQVTLTNLAAGESYTVAVSGADARGRQVAVPFAGRGALAVAAAVAGSAPATNFTTPADPDATAPAITSLPAVVWRSDRAALIRWRTNEIADSVVRFGRGGQPLADVAGAINDVSVHEVMLTNLDPGATYDYRVESTDPAGNGPKRSAVARFATLAVPATLAIGADKLSPQHLGTVGTVTFTARMSVGSGRFEYQFWLKSRKSGTYALKQGYGSAAGWAWTPDPLDPGAIDSYEVQVRARREGSSAPYDLSAVLGYALVAQPPVATVVLSVDKHSPQQAGTTINVRAEAGGGTGDYEYKFWVARNGGSFAVVPPGYVADKTLAWTPASAGSYKVAVWVRNAGSSAPFEKKAELSCLVLANAPVSALSLYPSPRSPQPVGTAVTFTAKATPGVAGAAVEYRFWLYAAASGRWVPVGDATMGYSAARIWHWTPPAAGDYQVMVYARTVGDPAPYEMLKKIPFRAD